MVGEGIDGLLGLAVRLFVGPRRPGRDLRRRLSDLQLPCRGLRRRPPRRALPRRCRRPGSADRPRPRDRGQADLPRQPGQPDGQLARRGRASRRRSRRCPEGCLLLLDEAYIDCAPAGTAPPLDPGRPAGAAVSHLLQGAWPRRRTGRLRDRRAGGDRGLRPGPQPFRDVPDQPGRRARRPRRPGLARPGRGPDRRSARPDRRDRPRRRA